MRVAIFDRVEPSTISRLPLRLVETCSRRAAIIMLVVTIPLVIALAVASFGLLMQAASAPSVRTVVAAHPAIGLEVLAGFAGGSRGSGVSTMHSKTELRSIWVSVFFWWRGPRMVGNVLS